MKISELIKRLEEVKAKHGDLVCVAHDGLDPSDPAIVVDVETDGYECNGLRVWGCWDKKIAFIRS